MQGGPEKGNQIRAAPFLVVKNVHFSSLYQREADYANHFPPANRSIAQYWVVPQSA